MKGFAIVLLALGTGLVGFLAGGGLGFVGSASAVGTTSTAAGMCMTVDAAAKQGMMTPAQANQLGASIGKDNSDLAAAVKRTEVRVQGSGQSCSQLLAGITQAAK